MFGFKKLNIKAKYIKIGDKLLLNDDAFIVNNFVKNKNTYILSIDRRNIIKQECPIIQSILSVEDAEKTIYVLRRKNIFDYIFGL